jgi:DNA-binding NtrC family response regulator
VRELQNVITRSAILSKGGLLKAEGLRFAGVRPIVQPKIAGPAPILGDEPIRIPVGRTEGPEVGSAPPPPASALDDDERERIRVALEACGGNQTRAAKMLGIARRTLVKRLGLLGLPRPRK